MADVAKLPPLSLYVHFPWCAKKCPYCDFNSHTTTGLLPEREYLEKLKLDLQQESEQIHGRRFKSIFFGGGTPSLASQSFVSDYLDYCEATVGFEPDIEITLEANPGTVERQKFSGYKQAGINRISLGVQSFNPIQLQRLGRIHSAEDALRAIDTLHSIQMDNFNLDLMYALPEQTIDDAVHDLSVAMASGAPHLSWYQLTIEQNTAFYRNPPTLPDDDMQYDMMMAGRSLLQQGAYLQYETSAYCQPDKQCRHNCNYWEFGDYVGVGAGAHGKISQYTADGLAVKRRQKTRVPEHYLSSINPCCSEEMLMAKDLPCEFFMNALRLAEGVHKKLFTQHTGLSLDVVSEIISDLESRKLLKESEDRFMTTQRGALFLNELLQEFLPQKDVS